MAQAAQSRRSALKISLTAILLVIITSISGVAYYRSFFIWTVPAAVIFIMVAGTFPFLFQKWAWLTGSQNKIVNSLAQILIVGSISFFGICGINYFCADSDSSHETEVTITAKFREERTRYRRLSRGRQIPVGTYYQYYVTVQFPNGRTKSLPIGLSEYNRMRIDSKHTISVCRGFWGIPVIKGALN